MTRSARPMVDTGGNCAAGRWFQAKRDAHTAALEPVERAGAVL
jgi:hypothetical protein